jgi:hypothetical protein
MSEGGGEGDGGHPLDIGFDFTVFNALVYDIMLILCSLTLIYIERPSALYI